MLPLVCQGPRSHASPNKAHTRKGPQQTCNPLYMHPPVQFPVPVVACTRQWKTHHLYLEQAVVFWVVMIPAWIIVTNTATHRQMAGIRVNLLSYTKHVFLCIYEQAHFNLLIVQMQKPKTSTHTTYTYRIISTQNQSIFYFLTLGFTTVNMHKIWILHAW